MRALIAVGLVLACGARMRSAADPAVSEAGRQSLSAFLRHAVAKGEVPGVVGMVVGRDRILYEGAFGKRDVVRNADMTADAVFRIASMTKPLTTAAILMLADEGRLTVDDPVGKYLPRFETSQVRRSSGSLTWAGLYNTHFFIDPASGIGVIVLMQVLPFYDEAAMRVYRGFEEAVYRSLH